MAFPRSRVTVTPKRRKYRHSFREEARAGNSHPKERDTIFFFFPSLFYDINLKILMKKDSNQLNLRNVLVNSESKEKKNRPST